MCSPLDIFKWVAALAVIAGIGVFIGWIGSRHPSSSPPVQTTATETAPEPPVKITSGIFRKKTAAEREAEAIAASQTNDAVAPVADLTNTNYWDDKIGDILGADSEITNKTQELFALYPTLPPAGQLEVAQHLQNFVRDEDYAPLGEILTNALTPAIVSESLLYDAMNRDNAIKMPIFLEIARDPKHPQAATAKDFMERILEEDYGNDWGKWEKKVQEWVKENP